MMLDQLDVQPGHRILEIGAGTGYNAALLAHLTGPSGPVIAVDIDPEVTAGARRGLDARYLGLPDRASARPIASHRRSVAGQCCAAAAGRASAARW